MMSSWLKSLQHGNRGASFGVSRDARPRRHHRPFGQRPVLVREIEQNRWNFGRERCPVLGKTASAVLGNGESTGIEKPAEKCWIVGAGPGAADLLTIRAANVLRDAEVIIYDELGAQGVLEEFANDQAEKIYVGKRGGRKSITQEGISDILVEQCLKGRRVVRLKGGCPSVFARCSDELRALRSAGVEVEMVPGISSPLAAPLLAGFPLTDRDVGRQFAVATAHAPASLNVEALSKIDTVALLMGGAKLAEIAESFVAAGRAPQTPVAVIRAAGTPEQHQWLGSLEDIAEITAGASLSPCIIVIGEVVSLGAPSSPSAP